MTRRSSLAELVLGIEGLALLRGLIVGSDEDSAARFAAIRRTVERADADLSERSAFPERSVEQGYAEWAATYDAGGNPLIHLEETVLLPLLERLPAGSALDAGCGTGRVGAHLIAAGHDVVGVDASPDMLAHARERVPQATFVEGRLEALPVDDGRFDLAVCCLALSHCRQLAAPVAELARAVRPGGRVIITDLHPCMVQLGGQAAYVDVHGTPAFVRSYAHLHANYLRAFAAEGLDVHELFEPPPDRPWFEMQTAAWSHVPEAFQQAFEGIPAAIVWSLVKR